ncbi:hypothetical protein ACFQU7_29035 [Pseudoroseomonas wenyumeiae]
MQTSTLPALFDKLVADGGTRPALRYRRARLTYAELGALVARAAGAFRQLGVEKGRPWRSTCPTRPGIPSVSSR